MKKKSKILIATSVMAILAIGGVAVGTTTALFKTETKSNVHVNTGNLNVGFYLTKEVVDEIDSTGMIVPKEADLTTKYGYYKSFDYKVGDEEKTGNGVDLGKDGYQGNFVFDNFVPTMEGKLTFMVVNNSTVAIDVDMGKTISGYYSSGPQIPDDKVNGNFTASVEWSKAEKTVLIGQAIEATLTFKFLGLEADQNEYQNCLFIINSILTATQVVAHQN
ncbi:MAG: hypothetical protein MJ225_02975 [Bacilli bacterium]|nr:hypothetical protein [Bacilli bacterium]